MPAVAGALGCYGKIGHDRKRFAGGNGDNALDKPVIGQRGEIGCKRIGVDFIPDPGELAFFGYIIHGKFLLEG